MDESFGVSDYVVSKTADLNCKVVCLLCNYAIPCGSEHENDTIIRRSKNGHEEMILSDWYYDHEFLNGEIRLLIDSVLFADGLSKKDRVDLIRRLEQLSSKHFHSEISKIDMNIYAQIENREILITLEDIGRAIVQGKQLSFVLSPESLRKQIAEILRSALHKYEK